MAELTLQDIFGANATQDADTITISKSDLTAGNFTPSLNNRGETAFLAMVLQAKQKLNEDAREIDKDVQIVIGEPSENLTTQSGTRYKVTSFTVELYKVDNQQPINVMDY